MPFIRPSLQTIIDRIIADYESRVDGAATFTRRSAFKIKGKVYGGAIHGNYGFLNYMADQLFVSTADSEYVDIHANEWGKVRKEATKATGSCIVTGTNGVAIPADSELVSDDSIIYVVDEEAIITNGSATLAITAKVAGADGNDDGNITLSFVSPVLGVNTIVTVTALGLTGGLDEESDSELKDRTLARKRQAPFGGAIFDYEVWAKEVAGVTRAWAFDEWQGVGTVGIAFARDNDETSIIPTADQRQTVYDYIIQHEDPLTGETVGKPVGCSLYMIPAVAYTVNFQIGIYPNNSTIRTNAESQLADLLLTIGPGEALPLSQVSAAISAVTDEEKNRIIYPTADIGFTSLQIPILGSVTWSNY